MKEKIISICNEFGTFPVGRFKTDSPLSGEKFRDDFLVPALKENDKVIVCLDNVDSGYGSSFLEEAFGGLVRECSYKESELKQRLELRSPEINERYIRNVWTFISEEEVRQQKGKA